jgi:hypothetical protein
MSNEIYRKYINIINENSQESPLSDQQINSFKHISSALGKFRRDSIANLYSFLSKPAALTDKDGTKKWLAEISKDLKGLLEPLNGKPVLNRGRKIFNIKEPLYGVNGDFSEKKASTLQTLMYNLPALYQLVDSGDVKKLQYILLTAEEPLVILADHLHRTLFGSELTAPTRFIKDPAPHLALGN